MNEEELEKKKRDWWIGRIAEDKKIAKEKGVCEHRTKVVTCRTARCCVCGKLLANNQKDAEKYYA